jgi:hypothetical protein
MGLTDRKGGVQYPYHRADVYNAILQAVKDIGFKIESADQVNGRILVKTGISWRSWNEDIQLQINDNQVGTTTVDVGSSASSQNLAKMLAETSKLLQRLPPVPPTTLPPAPPRPGTPVQPYYSIDAKIPELEKLADLKNRGLISEAEYEAKKKQLLGV